MEIIESDKLLKPAHPGGMTVVDLGASPGGWSQVVAEKFAAAGSGGGGKGGSGRVIALDLLPMVPLPGVIFLQGDFREAAVLTELKNILGDQPVDLVISDMSPNISGVNISDQARSMHLSELALEFCREQLKPGGHFLVKVFQGVGFEVFLRDMRASFTKVVTRKPEASRGRSSELYLLGLNKRVA